MKAGRKFTDFCRGITIRTARDSTNVVIVRANENKASKEYWLAKVVTAPHKILKDDIDSASAALGMKPGTWVVNVHQGVLECECPSARRP